MTKVFIVFAAVLLLLGICYVIFFGGSRVLDFRGEVIEIKGEGGEFVLTLDGGYGAYEITVDSRTKIKPCHKDDPKITMNDVKLGDTVEGNYRAFKEGTAKYIIVWYK